MIIENEIEIGEYMILEKSGETCGKPTWDVMNKHHEVSLGKIRWHQENVKEFCLFPDNSIVLSAGCIDDLTRFIKSKNGNNNIIKEPGNLINANMIENKPKTNVWEIMNALHHPLGIIKWYSSWRQYCFFPFDKTMLMGKYLDAIADALRQFTKKHREKKSMNC